MFDNHNLWIFTFPPLYYQQSFREESLLLGKANLPPYGIDSPSGLSKYHCQDLNFCMQKLKFFSPQPKTYNPVLKIPALGFPGGAVVENLPANAGDTGSSPGLGRSHMPRSNQAREPQLMSLRMWSLCSATREAAIVRGLRTAMRSGPHLPQIEKALTQKRRPNTAKK